MSDFFTDAGFTLPTANKSTPDNSTGALFKAAGFSVPTTAAAPAKSSGQFSDEIPIPVPGQPGYDTNVNDPKLDNPDTLENYLAGIAHDINPINIAQGRLRDIGPSISAAHDTGVALANSGLKDIQSRNYLPSFPGADPSTWSAGGLLKTAAGGVAAGLGAVVSGLMDALITHPVTELTGNPEIGQSVSNVAGLLIPGPKVVKAAKDTLPANKAINTLVDAIGPENVPAAVSRMASNPRLSLMDVSDPVRTMAQSLIDPAQPAAQNIITQNVKDRIATLPAATNSAYTAAMGPAPNVPAMLDALKQRAQDVGSKMIQPAIDNAGPVDVTDVVNSLDKTIGPYALKALQAGETPKAPMTNAQQTAWDLRQRLRGSSPDSTPNTTENMYLDPAQAHEIQSQMRYEASQLASSAVGSERLTAGQIGNVRGQLVNAIDDASDGTYKPALAKYRDAMTVQEAFEKGFDTLKNRSGVSGLEDRPDMFQKSINESSPEEVVARRLGTRLDIDQKLNGVKNTALAGQNIIAPEYNKQKLTTLFGEPEASRLIQTIDDTATEAQTNAKILSGSKTAETLAGREALKVPEVEPFKLGSLTSALLPTALAETAAEYSGLPPGLTGLSLLAGGAGLGVARKGYQSLLKSSAVSRNVAIAKAASATGETRDDLFNSLLSHPKVIRAAEKSGNSLLAP